MWIDEADGLTEIFKGYLPFYLLVALPIFILISPVKPVAASHEFAAYRMHQYDLHAVPHGCRSSNINLEGRSLTTWATSRHCVVARIQDITIDQLMEIRSKAGALLLVLPRNDTVLTHEEREHIELLEMAMAQQEFTIPVYFAKWSPDFDGILQDLQYSFVTDDKSGTALEAMFNGVSSNGYQIVISTSSPQKLQSKPISLHGKLAGSDPNAGTIVIAANYDSSAIAPELSFGADSNASGAVAVLELARIFSRLYSSVSTRGKTSLLFVLNGAGPVLNYFGTKKWLEEQLDSNDASLLQDVSFVMCLDSIASSDKITMHVSKPPKAGGAAHSIKSRLGAPIVHKKINLADEFLAWQHERFSIGRMTAFTLSSLESHKDPGRGTLLDTYCDKSAENLVQNIKQTARALASHIYGLTEEENSQDKDLYDEALNVDVASVQQWYKFLSSQSRSPHAISTASGNTVPGVAAALERALSRSLSDVTQTVHLVDKRDPEYTLYGPTEATLHVYSVKPAVFDLILTLAIVAYLGLLYLIMQAFPRFYDEYARLITGKTKVH